MIFFVEQAARLFVFRKNAAGEPPALRNNHGLGAKDEKLENGSKYQFSRRGVSTQLVTAIVKIDAIKKVVILPPRNATHARSQTSHKCGSVTQCLTILNILSRRHKFAQAQHP